MARLVLVAITFVTIAIVVASALLHIAADDLLARYDQARGQTPQQVRTVYGDWLAAPLATDIEPVDLVALRARADQLGYRSERLRELAAVPAVIGLLTALLSGQPMEREASQPAAKTSSNGMF